jgi:RNA polymerase sigma-70 factor (ECF subfamily)
VEDRAPARFEHDPVADQIRAAQRGDPLAMDALLTELAPWVGRLCAAIALDRAEDAMQETLIVVLRNLPTLREPGALRAWVRRIAVRQALRLAGDSRTVVMAEVPEIPIVPDIDTRMDVRRALETLSPTHRAVLALRYLDDLSERETADALGLPEGTVKSGLHRAKERFKLRWEGA